MLFVMKRSSQELQHDAVQQHANGKTSEHSFVSLIFKNKIHIFPEKILSSHH